MSIESPCFLSPNNVDWNLKEMYVFIVGTPHSRRVL